jgi:hypothetical protein
MMYRGDPLRVATGGAGRHFREVAAIAPVASGLIASPFSQQMTTMIADGVAAGRAIGESQGGCP